MRKNFKSILTLMIALALLVSAALPALAQTSGSFNLECSSFVWQVRGDDVQINVLLNQQRVGVILLTAQDPIKEINYKQGNCSISGSLKLWAKSVWGQGKLDMNVAITQGSSTYGHQGTVATW